MRTLRDTCQLLDHFVHNGLGTRRMRLLVKVTDDLLRCRCHVIRNFLFPVDVACVDVGEGVATDVVDEHVRFGAN